jgi:tetratricopeptide (TPR) repeat protein
LLLDALRREPQRASLNQSMGIVQLHEGHGPQAAVSFSKAAELCSGCILARFYNALALMQRDPGGAGHPGVETAFQDFIRFNPTFAPAYAALARFDATAGKNLSEARDLAAKASALDPHAIRYFFLEGEILLKMGNPAGALGAARQAVKEAQSPGEKSQAYVFLGTIQQRMSAATAGK